MKQLFLIILIASSLTLSACTSSSSPGPSTFNNPTDTPNVSEENTASLPTVTDDQMAEDLNNDLDLNLDQEFSDLESDLQ